MRRWFLGAAVTAISLAMLAAVVLAKPGVIVTKDGKRLEGDITEKPDQIIVNIHGIDTFVPRDSIDTLTYTEDFNKEFSERLSKLAPTDVQGRIALARWAFDRRQYGKAREALDAALAIDPNNREAVDLQTIINSQLRLEQNKGAEKPVPQTAPPLANGVERRLLTNDDINAIRQKELQPTDKVNVRFENNVERRFIKFRNLQFNDFNALTPVNKALKILEEGDETMKADVKILGDPASIFEYRRTIQPFVLNGCAASNCHGGNKGGDFILFSPADNDPVTYTDLYILMRYRKKLGENKTGGLFASPERKMVDRGHGVQSLLAQYGLPADVSEVDHPEVPGYDFVFRNGDDMKFKQIVQWMNQLLKQPEPDYGIKYDPPTAKMARESGPATRPTK